VRCDDAAAHLPALVDGSGHVDRRIVAHVESCLRCQAELVQYRRLLRALHRTRTDRRDPGPGLLADVLAAIEMDGEQPRAARALLRGHRAAYVGALAAAGTAGAIALASYSRKTRLAG
jgi:anti-sigma factor RsiW